MKKSIFFIFTLFVILALNSCSGCNSENQNNQQNLADIDSLISETDSNSLSPIDSIELNNNSDSNLSYCNKKYNYCVDLPNLKWTSLGESESGDGITYQYEGKMELIIYAEPHKNPQESLKTSYQSAISQSAPGYRVLNHNLSSDNFRIEGEQVDDKFLRYTKSIENAHLSIILKFKPAETKNAQRYLMILTGNIRKNKITS